MIRLYLKRLYWRYMLKHAKAFRESLEQTIAHERERAQRAVDHAEVMERRAYAAIVAWRADRRITQQGATE